MAATDVARDREHKQLLDRVAALAREHESDPQWFRASKGPWAEVVEELEAWAKRYDIPVMTREHQATAGPAGGAATPRTYGFCAGVMEDDGVTCTLKRVKRNGLCVYRCFPSPPGTSFRK